MLILPCLSLALALPPLLLGIDNLRRFHAPMPASDAPAVSVLIPARNEERTIETAVRAVLASADVVVDLVVLDDASTDRTAAILHGIADPRLRVASAPPLPTGWCGKQHACATLANLARHDLIVFLDADVQLAPDALCRMAGFMQSTDVGLASGFPRQITDSWAERLLLPLIYFLLLGYLPIARMRRSTAPAYGAGCGQLFIARAEAYRRAGGHGAIRASLHDGLTLPRAFRAAGIATDLFDASRFATCRMYDGARAVWDGLGKNATEGMASPRALPVWMLVLGGGQIMPALLAPFSTWALIALCCGIALRLILALRFRQSILSALLHPIGVAALLAVQIAALTRQQRGRPAIWRGRAYSTP